MANKVGIEKINIYGSSLCLDQKILAKARDKDPEKTIKDFLIDTRSLNPPWEDAVTMGANAAKKVMEDIDPSEIGMLIVGTEGAVDFGKPMSTNIMGALNLHNNIRNYEVKHACYSGVAALDTAVNWVASGLNKGRKALVIASDFSREHLNKKEEFVMGGAASAMIISETPKVIEFETDKKGTWSTDVYDTFRPSALAEVGNNEVSLYSYLDALEGSYEEYCRQTGGDVNFDTYFTYNLYHTPFPGMAFQAHRTLCNLFSPRSKAEIRENFDKKVLPGLTFSRRLGSTYGSSNFVGICSLMESGAPVKGGDRLGFFAYGSGAIGEFYSAVVCPDAVRMVKDMKIRGQLDSRRSVTVDEYEKIELFRNTCIEQPDFIPDLEILNGWYNSHYEKKGLLVLREVKDYYRTYEWS